MTLLYMFLLIVTGPMKLVNTIKANIKLKFPVLVKFIYFTAL